MSVAPPPPDPTMVLSSIHPITSITFDDDDFLFSGHQGGQIQEWNTGTQRARCSWDGHADAVISLSRLDHLLVSQGREGCVKIWRRESANQAMWTTHQQIPSAALIFCNTIIFKFNTSAFMAIPSEETAKIQVLELLLDSTQMTNNLQVISSLEPDSVKEYGMCMKMCSPGISTQKLLVGYESGIIALWDARKGICLALSRVHQDSVMCLDCAISNADPDTFIGISGSADKSIHKWTASSNGIVKSDSVDVTNAGFCDVKIRPDSRIFITGGWDGASRVFSLKKLRPLAILSYHKQSVQCLAFAGDKTIATGSKDGYIAIWDVYKNN